MVYFYSIHLFLCAMPCFMLLQHIFFTQIVINKVHLILSYILPNTGPNRITARQCIWNWILYFVAFSCLFVVIHLMDLSLPTLVSCKFPHFHVITCLQSVHKSRLWWDSNPQPLNTFPWAYLEVQCAIHCATEPVNA